MYSIGANGQLYVTNPDGRVYPVTFGPNVTGYTINPNGTLTVYHDYDRAPAPLPAGPYQAPQLPPVTGPAAQLPPQYAYLQNPATWGSRFRWGS